MLRSLTLRLCAAFLLAAVLFAPRAEAQDDLDIYGFFQSQLRYSDEQSTSGPEEVLSFSMQQLNLFASTQLTQEFSAFVNAEITNGYSTETGFGSLGLQEAWLRYNRSAALNVKAGLLVPTFNNLNEISNRTPLLPYVFRPIAYETAYATVLPVRALVPNQAFLQVNGTLPTGDLRFDYAAFVGNSESSYAAPDPIGSVVAGTDTTTSKLVGGRLGLRWRSAKVGVSGTYDQRQLDNLVLNGTALPLGLGDVQRMRLGADASFERGMLFGEAEAILALYGLDDEQQARLDLLSSSPELPVQTEQGVEMVPNQLAPVLSGTLDASFYHALLGVNITDQVFAYGLYNYLEDTSNTAFASGFDLYSAGVGYRPIFPVVLKAQYIHVAARENLVTDFSGSYLFLAASVQF
jgi:hypothetical protein